MGNLDYVEVAHIADLWEGEMEAYDVDDREILVVRLADGLHAYDGICPHQSFSLVEGSLDSGVVTCRAHEWTFDGATGAGINPRDVCLIRYGTRVIDGVLYVSRQALPTELPVDVSAGVNTGATA